MSWGKEKNNIVFDIETIVNPVTEEELETARNSYSPPSNYKTSEAISKHRAEFEANILQEILDKKRFSFGGKRMISCALGRVNDLDHTVEDIQTFLSPDLSVVTRGVADYLNEQGEYRLIGWNSKNFDLPELAKSFYLTGISPRKKPTKWDALDLKDHFRFTASAIPGKQGLGLKEAAQALGLEIKDVNGSNVQEMWDNGEFDLIAEYNAHDVLITGELMLALQTIYSLY